MSSFRKKVGSLIPSSSQLGPENCLLSLTTGVLVAQARALAQVYSLPLTVYPFLNFQLIPDSCPQARWRSTGGAWSYSWRHVGVGLRVPDTGSRGGCRDSA